eukprot:CAMPEP_0197731246 /NCGR_PEP_ID=MMETSP1434-20131217/36863_1 /TAXON_ID=265543 /ORGANISM="Minutocellus polymorphus, Strain CCMP3303" /LENGTH=78 /DNA_ID=CAMNT_0043318205 /DNA_START=136 /DNA_END=368 /DNA_ORIENTATION=-
MGPKDEAGPVAPRTETGEVLPTNPRVEETQAGRPPSTIVRRNSEDTSPLPSSCCFGSAVLVLVSDFIGNARIETKRGT